MADEFCLKMPDFHVTFRDLLHTVNLRHGTNGFTSLPKEGVLRIFSPANLGTKGQHATSRPAKLQVLVYLLLLKITTLFMSRYIPYLVMSQTTEQSNLLCDLSTACGKMFVFRYSVKCGFRKCHVRCDRETGTHVNCDSRRKRSTLSNYGDTRPEHGVKLQLVPAS